MIRQLTPVVVAALAAVCFGQQGAKEEPVGVVLMATGAKLMRSGLETAISARPGDILFAGDGLRTETGPATVLFCPASVSQTLQPSTEVLFQPRQIKVKSGSLGASQTVAACRLPSVVRVATASQQHYGVTMVRGMDKPTAPEPLARAAMPPEVASEIDKLGTAKDPASAIARATVYDKAGLAANALAEYQAAAAQWPDAVWVKGKTFELQEKLADTAVKAAASGAAGGQTFAVLVGISKYQKLPQDLWLQYANADATTLHKHLLSPRGGSVPPGNMFLLTDEKATTAGLRSALQTIEKSRAGKKDTVLIFIAGHGTVEVPGSKSAFIVTHDSDPQDLTSTAMPMAEIQELIQKLAQTGRVIALVDVCRAGTIGTIRSTGVNSMVERLGESEGEILGLMASRPKELSYEGPQFGGGHGAFSYYLLKALEGDADKNKDGVVNVNEVIEYVREKVAAGTNDKQHPRDFGNIENTVPLSDTKKTGIELARSFRILEYGSEPLYLASAAQTLPAPALDLAPYSEALAAGRLAPDEPGSAFGALRSLQSKLTPEQYMTQENRLRVALEDRAQQTLLRYLAGDEVPQVKRDFSSAGELMTAARSLTPESLYLDARQSFFEGRALLFDKRFSNAADLLERCVRLDPASAYGYNALGIAYLEQGDFPRAISAFRDSVRRAPHWAYPLHNLALAHFEMGDYDAAIRSYRQAIRLRPDVSYLPYNLGLVYQKLNLTREAEAAYRTAMTLAPASAEPLNAIGALKSSTGRYREAESWFRQALGKNPNLLAARHNLALVLARDKDRQKEAAELWRKNLETSPDHMPSLLGLAETEDKLGDTEAAIAAYRTVAAARPDYAAAHLELSKLLQRRGDMDGALSEATTASRLQPNDPGVAERTGDLYAAKGDHTRAAEEYRKALENAGKPARKSISGKLSKLGKT